MATHDLFLELFAFPAASKPSEPLEARIKRFLEKDKGTESLDGPAFDHINGAETKADYLLGGRRIVTELKTLNGDPLLRVEERVRQRLSQPGAPLVYGQPPFEQVLGALGEGDELAKTIIDISSRAVRKHLRKADDQIAAIKARLNLPEAAGLLVLMNDSEEMIDAATIGYTLKATFDADPDRFANVTNIWVSVESHRIRMPDGRLGYAQLHVYRSRQRKAELDFMHRLLAAWGHDNGASMHIIPHRGDWDTMGAVYDNGPPVLAPYEPRKS